MGLHNGGLLIWWSLLLGLAQLLDETHGLTLETALEPATGAGVDELETPKFHSVFPVCKRHVFMNIPQRTKCSLESESCRFRGDVHTHLFIAQIQELVEFNSTVGERTERPLLLELSGEGGVGDF